MSNDSFSQDRGSGLSGGSWPGGLPDEDPWAEGGRRRSRPTRVLLWLSGANTDILDRFPSDVPKYVGIGAAVLTTSTMAGISCAFALRMALGLSPFFYLLLGVAWGFAIMSLDRWLVVSMQRRDHWYQILPIAIPRLALAILIGVVISTPLVLRIFEAEITTELSLMRSERDSEFLATTQTDERGTRIKALEAEQKTLQATIDTSTDTVDVSTDPDVARIQKLVDAKQEQYDAAEQAVICENEGTCGSGKVGRGPAYAEKVALRDRYRDELSVLNGQLTTAQATARSKATDTRGAAQNTAKGRLKTVETELTDLRTARTAAIENFRKENGKENGLLIRIEALDNLTAHRPALGLAHRFLLVFITAIECLPIIVKFIISVGPANDYEQAVALDGKSRLRAEEERIRHRRAAAIMANAGLHRRRAIGVEIQTEAAEHASEAALNQLKRRMTRDARRNPQAYMDPTAFSTRRPAPVRPVPAPRRSRLDNLLARIGLQQVSSGQHPSADQYQPYPSNEPIPPSGPFFDGDSGNGYGQWRN
ncbi:hypothetical protein ACG83_04520 [Frankia sp. R43]|uniref:DUF4407 domain-containing protein n=1 Tax=Frankia sp. R43 TaxID=269536 RepID=UPI0006CA5BCD|nr:DUF4407 domain-containing protein [Frankia sp. R43]KPM57062.1 hypothetical protein ACG83_04520 [Frankia sp. R43]